MAPDKGQSARSPVEIPPRGWWEIGTRTARKFADNELMSEAASVTFFALLSLFPAITAIVSIYGLFNDPATIQGHLDAVAGFVPSGGMEIINDQVRRLTQTPTSGLSLAAIGGVLAALWSANQGSKAMLSALNDVYGAEETRSFTRRTATSLAFTAGGILGLLIAVGGIAALPSLCERIGLDGVLDAVAKIARWPLILLGLIVALSLLYRFGPSRNVAKWRWVTWGGGMAAVLWIAFSAGFSWYVEHFGSYNKTYGSLGAIIGFMTWIWLSSTVVLLGAQVNAEMETQTERDTTARSARAIGDRAAAANGPA
jgi:membrane protein